MANFISIFRIFLVFISVFLLYKHSFYAYITALVLTIFAFALDGLDGYIARKFKEESKLGAVLDIMGDRIAEYTYWVTFAVLGWLPLVFPLIVLVRGVVTDSLRSVALQQGMTAFGSSSCDSMQQDTVSQFICCSKFMRITYAVAKALAFVLLILAYTPGINAVLAIVSVVFALIFAEISVLLCILRGIPVVLESKKLFN